MFVCLFVSDPKASFTATCLWCVCVNKRLVIEKCRRLGGANEGRGRDGAGPTLKWLFDLQSRPGCSRLEHCGKALR